MRRPLAGVRVLAIEQYGAGPYGTQLMAELGADVVKIEPAATGGDVSRQVGPYLLGEDDSLFFQTFSRGKKSLSLDIRSAEGRERFERLVAIADVVLNNLRGDRPEKLAITYDALRSINPAIVCAHVSAYGREGSRADWPGYDYLAQAEAGMMSLTGEPGSVPTRFGLSVVDFLTGTMAAFGAVSALLAARATGIGCDVDISLFDTALHQLSYPAVWTMNSDYRAEPLPRGAHPSIAPSQIVRTRDGWGLLMCQTPKMWQLFCAITERPELADDDRFADAAARRAHRAALSEILDEIFTARSGDEWQQAFAGKVPFAPVRTVAEALANPFVSEVGMRDRVDHPARPEGIEMLACPIKVNGERMPGARAPALGEHDDALIWGVR